MSKERLTEKTKDCFGYRLKDGSDAEVGFFKDYDAFYSHMMTVRALGEYEDLEEQNLLLKLPTKDAFESSGGTVYYIYDYEIVECINCGLSIDCEGKTWIALACDEDIFPYRTPDAEHDLDHTDWCQNTTEVLLEEWDKSVFLTQSEAEEKLRELEGK